MSNFDRCMPPIRCLEPLLARGRQYEPDHSPVEDLLTPVPADPVEHDIAGKYPHQADGQRKPPPDETLVAHNTAAAMIGISSGIGTPRLPSKSTAKTPRYVKLSTNSWSAST